MHYAIVTLILVSALIGAVLQFLPLPTASVIYERPPVVVVDSTATSSITVVTPQAPVDTRPVVSHVPLPESVKLIYMSACVAGTPSLRQNLVTLIQETELNAVMIDIKDFSGGISFAPAITSRWYPAWEHADCGVRDMQSLIAELHELDIYVVGRITVFQDPFYATSYPEQAVQRRDQETVWRDYKGLSFIDVAAKPYWDHLIELAVLSYNIGFDELNFDYIRYPSDGNMKDIYFPQSIQGEYGSDKSANLEAFFSYLYEALQQPDRFGAVQHASTGRAVAVPWTSADLFGMTTTNYDDLSIGQIQERAAPYFDFIAPMVYPSHYPDDFLGLGDPNDHPYEIVYHAMLTGVERMQATTTTVVGFLHEPIMTVNASGTREFTGVYQKSAYGPDKFRTWIQDFDYGGYYDAAAVRAQIQASYDAEVDSWMIWAPSNIYTRAALEPAVE